MNMKKEPTAKIEPTEIQVAVGKARACIPKLVKVQGQLLSVQNGLSGKKLAFPIRENVIETLKESCAVCMQLQTACNFSAPEINKTAAAHHPCCEDHEQHNRDHQDGQTAHVLTCIVDRWTFM